MKIPKSSYELDKPYYYYKALWEEYNRILNEDSKK